MQMNPGENTQWNQKKWKLDEYNIVWYFLIFILSNLYIPDNTKKVTVTMMRWMQYQSSINKQQRS